MEIGRPVIVIRVVRRVPVKPNHAVRGIRAIKPRAVATVVAGVIGTPVAVRLSPNLTPNLAPNLPPLNVRVAQAVHPAVIAEVRHKYAIPAPVLGPIQELLVPGKALVLRVRQKILPPVAVVPNIMYVIPVAVGVIVGPIAV